MNNLVPLVINWHLTEACNFGCRYCYAAWRPANRRELIHDSTRTTALLGELYRFFQSSGLANRLISHLTWGSVRLNLAGGEPTLYARKLPFVIGQARALGFEVSLISNGSRLDDEWLGRLAPELTWLGISIDSADPVTNRAIGRVDGRDRLLGVDVLLAGLAKVRRANPGLGLKLNTVVNRHNHSEDLGPLIRRFAPDKWKVLRMLPVVNQLLTVSDAQFAAFVERHRAFAGICCVEDNQDMRESYLMVDPHGRFFQNSATTTGQGYVYSRPILEVGAEAAFAEMVFDHERFSSRYIAAVEG